MKAMSYFNRQGRNKENLRAPYNMLGSRQNERIKKKDTVRMIMAWLLFRCGK